MSFWAEESLRLAQIHDRRQFFCTKKPCREELRSTISPWDAPSTEENVRGGRVIKVETEN